MVDYHPDRSSSQMYGVRVYNKRNPDLCLSRPAKTQREAERLLFHLLGAFKHLPPVLTVTRTDRTQRLGSRTVYLTHRLPSLVAA